MNNFIFQNATKVYFGKGCVKEYLSCLTRKADTVMLAYGGGSIKRNGVYDEVTGILHAAGKTVVEFSGIMADTVDNWDDYDTVFIGYPIWWGIAAWPVDGFIEANDFSGKTVIPFCTSASSSLGESGQLLADMAGTGDWQEGHRFSSSVSEDDVQAWLDELGL